jgi:hypothetical protein
MRVDSGRKSGWRNFARRFLERRFRPLSLAGPGPDRVRDDSMRNGASPAYVCYAGSRNIDPGTGCHEQLQGDVAETSGRASHMIDLALVSCHSGSPNKSNPGRQIRECPSSRANARDLLFPNTQKQQIPRCARNDSRTTLVVNGSRSTFGGRTACTCSVFFAMTSVCAGPRSDERKET